MGRVYCGCGKVGDHVCEDRTMLWTRRCPTCDALVSPRGAATITCRNGHTFATDEAMALTTCEGCEGHPGAIPGVRFPTAANSDPSHPWIERCDHCEEFESDADAADALVKAGRIVGWRYALPVGSTAPTPYAVYDETVGEF